MAEPLTRNRGSSEDFDTTLFIEDIQMKKIVIVAFAFVMLMSAMSFATSTRTWVMGDNDRIMVDDGNIFRYPGRTFNYPNLALGEFSDGDFDNFGITWQFGEESPWVLGTFVSTWPSYGPIGYDGSYLANFYWLDDYYYPTYTQSTEELNDYGYPRRIQMLYSRQFSNVNFGFGLDVTRASWEYDQDSTTAPPYTFAPNHAKQSFSQYNFTLGLTEATSGKWDVAAYFMFGSWTNENDSGFALTEPNGYYEMGITGRYFYVYNPKITFVPHAEFGMGKRGTDMHVSPYTEDLVADSTWTIEQTGTMIDLGVGMNYTTGPKMLAVMDFGFDMASYKKKYAGGYANWGGEDFTGEEKYSYVMLPYFKIGFEGEVFSWLDVRAGGQTQLWLNKEKYESDYDINETYDTPYNDTYLGCGFHFGRLHLDTYMDPEILTNGLYFINGDSTSSLNWSVSMLYELF